MAARDHVFKLSLSFMVLAASSIASGAALGEEAAAPEGGVARGLTIEEAQRIAIDRNLTVRMTAQELQRAEGFIQQAWASIFPSLGVGVQYTLADQPTVVSFDMGTDVFGPAEEIVVRQQHVAQLQVTARQPLFNGQSIPMIRLSHTSRELSRLTVEQVRRQIVLAVAQAFYAIVSAGRTVELLDRHLALAQEHVAAARARLEAQAGLAIDVARAELQVESTRSQRENALLGFQNARDALALLLGMQPDELPRLVEPGPLRSEVGSSEELVEQALAERLDLRAAERQVRIAELDLDTVWMSFLPSLNLSWALNYTLSELGGFGDRRYTWNLVAIASFPLFDGGVRTGQVRDRRARLEQARLNAESLERSSAVQVRQAFRAWRTAITTLEISGRQLQLATEAHRLARAAYEAGAASNLEVVDAQRSLVSAEVDRELRRLTVQIRLIELLASLEISPPGGGASVPAASSGGAASAPESSSGGEMPEM
jgi:outer membrane protein TolC